MLINETSKVTNLTKKAIEYYVERGLITPTILENGYRDFSDEDIEQLKKISTFRRLGLTIEEINKIITDKSGEQMRRISVQREIRMQKEQEKKIIYEKLCLGKSYAEIAEELEAIEESTSISEKLLEAFPGYYGRFICLHFSQFLNEPITTHEQRIAYNEIINFLDNVPTLILSEELNDFLNESTKDIDIKSITEISEDTKYSLENVEEHLMENKDLIDQYLAYKQSDEYKNSPAHKLEIFLKEFNEASGYYETFIPAMKKLSPAYAKYYQQMEKANEKFLQDYPDYQKNN